MRGSKGYVEYLANTSLIFAANMWTTLNGNYDRILLAIKAWSSLKHASFYVQKNKQAHQSARENERIYEVVTIINGSMMQPEMTKLSGGPLQVCSMYP